MSAEIDSMFSVRERPWHGEGTILDDYPGSWDEARKLAGLDWEPQEVPMFTRKLDPVTLTESFVEIGGHKALVRDDTGAVLSTQADSYTLIPNAVLGEIVEAVLDQPNVRYETAGSLKNGRVVWALVRLDLPFEIPGDNSPTYSYMAMLNSHDGSAACKVLPSNVRVVCWNTFQGASVEGDRSGRQYTFRHTRKVMDRIEDAKAAIRGTNEAAVAWRKLATDLSLLKITPRQRELFIVDFVPMPPEGLISDRVVVNVETARSQIRKILASPTCEGIDDTAYGLLQATGEYLDHVRGWHNRGTLLGRTILRPEPLKTKALSLIREVVAA